MAHAFLNYQLLVEAPHHSHMPSDQRLILVVKHAEDGALGLCLNQFYALALGDLFKDIGIVSDLDLPQFVLQGGVERPEVGVVLHTGQPKWQSSFVLNENVCMTTSKDIMQALAENEGVDRYQVILGYTTWSAGELEAEIKRGAWLVCSPDESLLFDVPHDERWSVAAHKIGLDSSWLTHEIGHA